MVTLRMMCMRDAPSVARLRSRTSGTLRTPSTVLPKIKKKAPFHTMKMTNCGPMPNQAMASGIQAMPEMAFMAVTRGPMKSENRLERPAIKPAITPVEAATAKPIARRNRLESTFGQYWSASVNGTLRTLRGRGRMPIGGLLMAMTENQTAINMANGTMGRMICFARCQAVGFSDGSIGGAFGGGVGVGAVRVIVAAFPIDCWCIPRSVEESGDPSATKRHR